MEEERDPRATTAHWRLIWYPRLVLVALGLSLVFVVSFGSGSATATGRVGGDYPAFYGAGTIVLDAGFDRLYDPSVQAAAQSGLHGAEAGYLAFAYPPHVAAAYAPLAWLPYRISYLVHTGLMAGAVLVALALMRPLVRIVDRWYWPCAAATLTVFPLFRAVGAGQNTAVTLLLLAMMWRALATDREWLAGIAAGLMLFRPQYALPVIGLLWFADHRKAVITATAVGATTWLVAAVSSGPAWFSDWMHAVGPFIETDAEVNARNSVSWIGFGEALAGSGSPVALVAGGALATATAVALVIVWRNRRFDLSARMAVTTGGLLLMSPHTMFYDAGVLVIAVLVALDRGWLTPGATAILWAASLGHLLAPALGATPLALVVIVVFVFILKRSFAAAAARTPEPVLA